MKIKAQHLLLILAFVVAATLISEFAGRLLRPDIPPARQSAEPAPIDGAAVPDDSSPPLAMARLLTDNLAAYAETCISAELHARARNGAFPTSRALLAAIFAAPQDTVIVMANLSDGQPVTLSCAEAAHRLAQITNARGIGQ